MVSESSFDFEPAEFSRSIQDTHACSIEFVTERSNAIRVVDAMALAFVGRVEFAYRLRGVSNTNLSHFPMDRIAIGFGRRLGAHDLFNLLVGRVGIH